MGTAHRRRRPRRPSAILSASIERLSFAINRSIQWRSTIERAARAIAEDSCPNRWVWTSTVMILSVVYQSLASKSENARFVLRRHRTYLVDSKFSFSSHYTLLYLNRSLRCCCCFSACVASCGDGSCSFICAPNECERDAYELSLVLHAWHVHNCSPPDNRFVPSLSMKCFCGWYHRAWFRARMDTLVSSLIDDVEPCYRCRRSLWTRWVLVQWSWCNTNSSSLRCRTTGRWIILCLIGICWSQHSAYSHSTWSVFFFFFVV